MFTLNIFKKFDSSFLIISSKENISEITTLCSLDCLYENGIIFIKNNKYYQKLRGLFKNGVSIKNIGVIFQQSFFKSLNVDDESVLFDQFNFYATVESIDLAISNFSKLFFDKFNKEGNDLIDGRQMGTTDIHPSSSIAQEVFLGQGVKIAADVIIYPGCVILSNSKIGEGTVLYPNVSVYRNVVIGQHCRIHANTVIGSDGFRYNFYQGDHLKVWHFGGVVIEDSVEIGSNTSIDQGTFSPTVIGRGSKIDNQVQIAHNCRLGEGVIVCGQTGLAGSVKLGNYVIVGGAASIAPGVEIGDYAQIGGMSGVTSNVPEKTAYGGHPARPINEWLKSYAILRKISLRNKRKECSH